MKIAIAVSAILVIWLTSVYPSWTFKIADEQSYAGQNTTVDSSQDNFANFSNDIAGLATKAALDALQNAEALELLFKKIEKLENSNQDLKEKLAEMKSKTQNEMVQKPTEVKLQKVAPVSIEGYYDQHYNAPKTPPHYYETKPHYYVPNAGPKKRFWKWIGFASGFAAKSLVWAQKLLRS